MNPILQQIHALLLAQQNAMSQTLDVTTDIDKAKAIVLELQEILHRINLVQNLLFSETSSKLKAALPGIKKSSSALSNSIQSISDTGAFLASAASFLKTVDQAIDIAKTLAV